MAPNNNLKIGLGVVMLIVVVGAFYFYHSALASIGNLNIYNGSAEVKHGETTITGQTGTPIGLKDVIRVPQDSRASIILKDGSEIRLEAGTKIVVANISYNGKKISGAVFDLLSGHAWSHVNPIEKSTEFRVETPTVVATVRGTNFDISYGSSTSEVYVSTHAVWTWLRLHPEKTIKIDAGGFMIINDGTAEADFAEGVKSNFQKDDWTIFNENLDGPEPAQDAPTSTPTTTLNTNATFGVTPTPTTPGGVTLLSLALTTKFAQSTTNVNQVIPLLVTATYSDGSRADVTSKVTWTQTPALDAIDSTGNFHVSSNVGTTSVTASLNGVKSNVLQVSVNQSVQSSTTTLTLIGLSVTCQKTTSTSFTNSQLPTAQCKAVGTYSNRTTGNLTSQVQWKVSGTAGGSINTSGLYTPQAQGTANISAVISGVSGSVQISIP